MIVSEWALNSYIVGESIELPFLSLFPKGIINIMYICKGRAILRNLLSLSGNLA